MKRIMLLCIIGLYVCLFLSGCHTLDMLSRVKTGKVDFKDAWQAIVADDEDFRDAFW